MLLNYIHWNPDPEIFNIGGFSLRYYGFLFMSGLILCIYFLRQMFKKENIPSEHVETLFTYGMIGIFIGARLGHCLFYEPSYYLSNPLEMLFPISFLPDGGIEFTGYRGLASHGGVLGMIGALYFYSRKTNHPMINAIDLVAVVAGLSLAMIRLGNFMNSEIVGMPTTQSWGVIFERVDMIPRHPAQLYEAISYLIIFVVMMMLYNQKRDQLQNGFFFGLALVLISTVRFLIEFVKENQVGFEDGMVLNMGQLLSIPFVIVGIGFMIYGIKRTNQTA